MESSVMLKLLNLKGYNSISHLFSVSLKTIPFILKIVDTVELQQL